MAELPLSDKLLPTNKLNDNDKMILADIIYECFTDYCYITDRGFVSIARRSMKKIVEPTGRRRETIYNALISASDQQILRFIRALIQEAIRRPECKNKIKDIIDEFNVFLTEKFGLIINENGELLRATTKTQEQISIFNLPQETKCILVDPIFHGRGFQVEKDLCFVLIPFKTQFYRIFENIIKLALEEVGFKVVKADDIFEPGPVIEQIWEYINKAEIILADVTGRNPNVFYELGIAHTLGKNVIIITQSEDDVPFDLRHLRYFKYEDNEKGWEKLKETLKKVVTEIQKEVGS
ncbi:hypothetical protein [Geoglobus acetivorans]|uniref:Nucleoside 2-deoxyribosyltransferase n=1 Tax=Geoglobus acetivorans TaxID=565033 RepID=A0ABZ3H1D5_GEOAI|nr:hypothetical protein [Geoglobus acetivorans]